MSHHSLFQAAHTLTKREKQILLWLTRGRTSKEIADALHISNETVKTHRANLMSKLQVRTGVQLGFVAVKMNLVTESVTMT